MTDASLSSQPKPDGARLAGGVLTAAAIGSFVLLALHPGGTATDFAGILRQEAAGQTMDAIVHGGFIALLSVEMVCYLVLTLRLKRLSALAGMVFFAVGVALLSGSLVTDGLVIPAIAAKYLPVPAKLETARSLFVLCESFIRVLMPMGLAFQAAAMAAWGWALLRSGMARVVGVCGLVAGVALLAALGAQMANPLVPMAAIAALALWALALGVVMMRKVG
jgi:hypothetical protein